MCEEKDSALAEPLIGQVYTEVVAPSNLPEGYTFKAEAGGWTFPVTVPAGGVEEGQTFMAPLPPGNWKDGLCECFSPGCCHPSVWCAFCCPLVLVSQIMNRLGITWLGRLGSVRTLLAISVVYYVVTSCLGGYVAALQVRVREDDAGNPKPLPPPGPALLAAGGILRTLYSVTMLVLVCRIRKRVRDRDGIRPTWGRCQDCCCSFWCECCALAQMARQTADYDVQKAECYSDTGLSPGAAEIA